jgi:hypothetical protein
VTLSRSSALGPVVLKKILNDPTFFPFHDYLLFKGGITIDPSFAKP